jgi:hypothetical protein
LAAHFDLQATRWFASRFRRFIEAAGNCRRTCFADTFSINIEFDSPNEELRNRMMTLSKVGEYVTAEPFRPFRIKMASGQSFDIRHPEMILVGRNTVRVYTSTTRDEPEKWHDASLVLMEIIEPIDLRTTAST